MCYKAQREESLTLVSTNRYPHRHRAVMNDPVLLDCLLWPIRTGTHTGKLLVLGYGQTCEKSHICWCVVCFDLEITGKHVSEKGTLSTPLSSYENIHPLLWPLNSSVYKEENEQLRVATRI
jgi:hypothetical protein